MLGAHFSFTTPYNVHYASACACAGHETCPAIYTPLPPQRYKTLRAGRHSLPRARQPAQPSSHRTLEDGGVLCLRTATATAAATASPCAVLHVHLQSQSGGQFRGRAHRWASNAGCGCEGSYTQPPALSKHQMRRSQHEDFGDTNPKGRGVCCDEEQKESKQRKQEAYKAAGRRHVGEAASPAPRGGAAPPHVVRHVVRLLLLRLALHQHLQDSCCLRLTLCLKQRRRSFHSEWPTSARGPWNHGKWWPGWRPHVCCVAPQPATARKIAEHHLRERGHTWASRLRCSSSDAYSNWSLSTAAAEDARESRWPLSDNVCNLHCATESQLKTQKIPVVHRTLLLRRQGCRPCRAVRPADRCACGQAGAEAAITQGRCLAVDICYT